MTKIDEGKLSRCPVLVQNIENLSNSTSFLKSLAAEFKEIDPEVVFQNYEPLNIYKTCFNAIAEKYSIPTENIRDVEKKLEAAALLYLAMRQRRDWNIQVGIITGYLNKVVKKAKELELLLVPEREKIQQVFHIYSMFEDAKKTGELINFSIENLKQLQNLSSIFLSLPGAKISSYGKKAPMGHPGLQEWVRSIFLIWIKILNRSIENPNDGINGRIHLLDFMYDCREPLHPLLEHDTLDSMLRKVQKQYASSVNN